jgi:4-hydroxy 2-oxovalerate aldolase
VEKLALPIPVDSSRTAEGVRSSTYFPAPSANRVEILECTLRDGSYAVDFKFTERDTEVLASILGRLGFRWIEVGHGLGLGAAQAGKGTMPATDERLIESAKRVAPNAMIGSFFIPGIGTREHLRSARAAGLDFVRVGYNAPEIEEAYPYLEFARELGLIPCLNFMKTYGLTPKEFGEKALGGEKSGAAAVYCVDSAGSMFPDNVRGYIGEARQRCQCALGFHGHSNLQFAVANSVEAFRSGARLIDSTLYGIGRSSGNVPTEVAVAVFQRLGVETGIDLFEVMDAAEEFLEPLMSQIQLYDMMAVSMGYSQFHSSFLPKVAAAARKHGVDLRRLVIAMGELDPVNLDEHTLERVASNLPKRKTARSHDGLTSFRAPGISEHSISSSLSSVKSLVEGMVVTCAKRRARAVLELVAAESPSTNFVLADLVLAEDSIVLGRVTYGSFEMLEQVLAITKNDVSVYLVDLDSGAWGTELPAYIKEMVGVERIIPIRSRSLLANYLDEVMMSIAQRYGGFCLMIYGSPDTALLKPWSQSFKNVVVRGELPADAPSNCLEIENFSDRMHFDLGISAALLLCPPSGGDALSIDQLMQTDGVILTAGYFPRLEQDLPHRSVVRLDPNDAYRGQMARWAGIASLLKSAEGRTVAIQ